MGLYDMIKCDYPLEEEHSRYQKEIFQTKSLNNALDNYIITKTGELWWTKNEFLDDDDTQTTEPKQIFYTGEIRFYHWDKTIRIYLEYVVFFSKGKLLHIEFTKTF
jgi:hypothetical protein